jgi:hypothetical protein
MMNYDFMITDFQSKFARRGYHEYGFIKEHQKYLKDPTWVRRKNVRPQTMAQQFTD